MKELAKKIRECKACELHKTTNKKVVGKGSQSPDVLFVGEAPGEEENNTGVAFCGRSGKKLDEIISEAKIENYAIINTVKCHPPKNRNPNIDELLACKPFFVEQIRLLKPKKIIALGKIALAQLGLQSDTILSRVGKIEKSEFGNVFIAPHPSYLLRNPNYSFPYSALELFLNETERENKGKELLSSYKINKQEAENLAKFEMISAELASLHSFCKRGGRTFVDVNQKNLCKIDDELTFIKEATKKNEACVFKTDSGIINKNVNLFLFYKVEKANVVLLGWVTRDTINKAEVSIHAETGEKHRKLKVSELGQMNEILPIYSDEKETVIKKQPFTHLHVHSEYSIGDGYGTMKQLADSLYKKGFTSCALTDHGTLAGSIYWQKALLAKGIKPIFGNEIYLIMEKEKEAKRYHLILLAKNETGWKNLLKLNALAVYDNFYYKPRTFIDDIIKHKEGLIVSTACLGGYSSKMFLTNQPDKAEKFLLMLHKEFGDDFYVELMPNRIPEQRRYNEFLLEMIEKHGFKYIITTDSHYPEADQEKFHKAVKAILTRKTYEDAGFDDDTFYLQVEEDIRKLMKENHPLITDTHIENAFAYSNEISDKCDFEIKPFVGNTLPKLYDDPVKKLRELSLERLEKNTPYSISDPKIKERFDLELDRVIEKHYENYFILVYDYVEWCNKNGIMVGPGRGSAAASLVSYALNITTFDPIKFKLLFDRFISEIRADMPDIDLDFEDSKRPLVFKYLKEKHGEKNNAKVITYSKWHAKGAMRDIGRIFGIPLPEINVLCKSIIERLPGEARSDKCLIDTFEEIKQTKDFYNTHKFACDIAIKLESHIRHRGIHAAGIVITAKPVSEYVPIERIGGEYAISWDKKEVGNIGLIKFDILGLKTLSVISDTIKLVEERNNLKITLPTEFEDPEVYNKIYKKGNTLGVFQFETPGLSNLSKELNTDCFRLVYDGNALYRPGPLQSGETADYILRHNKKKEWGYEHPLLEPITKDTYGLILYQEQVMKIMVDIGKFNWSTAETARNIIGKSKGKDEFNKLRDEFCINANREHGISEKDSNEIFDTVATFGAYGLNLAHSVSYSIVSYYTAWLKTYYPAEFFIALMSKEKESAKIAQYIRDVKKFAGLNVLVPDINDSGIGFSFNGKDIIAGLNNIKGFAEKTSYKLIAGQPYDSLEDFVIRGKPTPSVFKALTCVGALDRFCGNRKAMFELAEKTTKRKFQMPVLETRWSDKEQEMKQIEYLDLPSKTPLIDMYDNPFADKIKFEKINELKFEETIRERWIKGTILSIKFKQNRSEICHELDGVVGRRYAHMVISDGTGNALVHITPEQYTYYREYLEKGAGLPLLIKGHSLKGLDKIYCDALIVLNDIDYSNPITKYIDGKTTEIVDRLLPKFPELRVGTIQSATYRVSKNGNPYARIQIVEEEGTSFLCFKFDSDIFIAGEILVYKLTEPFIDVQNRVK